MFQPIRIFLQEIEKEFDQISDERKEILSKISDFVQSKYNNNEPIKLVYICTHNSRRSHFGQVAVALAAAYYNIDNVHTFSGGTEATAFHPNAINALQGIGFQVVANENETNPVYQVSFGVEQSTRCFSKVYNHEANPKEDFAAIMTCSDAEQNCPYIPGVSLRIGTTYNDPKKSDGTPEQQATYLARFRQIATETMYAFSLVR